MHRQRDESGFIKSVLLKVILSLALFGVIAFDAGSIAWNYFSSDSTADDIAFALTDSRDEIVTRLLRQEARQLAKEKGVKLVKLEVTDEEVRVEIVRKATTVVVGRIGAISDWARATATGSAPTS